MLPDGFIQRMRPYLGAELDALVEALCEGAPVRALRAAGQADAADVLTHLSDFSPRPIPYEADGFYFEGEGIGHTPMHHAGGIYVQDPGAMAAVAALDIPEDARVLDLCAAPGGKSSQVARHLTEGFLIANEVIPSRARITVSNVERLGLCRTAVTSLEPKVLAELYGAYFDLVIVDAPCSGEGMFRKNEQALTEWSEEGVLRCAERQAHILDCAAHTVTPGGRLLYSTCTFSPEENEMTVDAFLGRHRDFHLIAPSARVLPYTAPGLPLCYKHMDDPALCRRFYPHISPGEGQFFAVLERENDEGLKTIVCKNAALPLTKRLSSVVQPFLKDVLTDTDGLLPNTVGERLVLLPEGANVPPHGVFAAGVAIGEVRGEVLKPHHQLFSALGHRFRRQLSLAEDDARLAAYLRGEEIADGSPDGYCAVLYGTLPLGGGKCSGGRVKNHYPKGLRRTL